MKKKWLKVYNHLLVSVLALTGVTCSSVKHVSEEPPVCIYGPPTDLERPVVMYGVRPDTNAREVPVPKPESVQGDDSQNSNTEAYEESSN